MKAITVHNPDNLKTAPYTEFIELQGDLKTLPAENLEKLKQSITTYGIRFPAFIWLSETKKYIVDAHQRMKALAALEAEGYIVPEVPYTQVHATNKKEAAELLLQANSRYGVINEATTFFNDFDIDLSFLEDIEIPELNIKLEELAPETVEDEVPEVPNESITKRGELWVLGRHRLLCGDSTDKADVERLMQGKEADCVLTDPPYGINQKGIPNDTPEISQELIKNTISLLPVSDAVIVAFQSTRTFPIWLDAIRAAGHSFERMLSLYKEAQCTYPWRGWILKTESILVSSIGKPKWQDVKPYVHDTYKLPEVSGEFDSELGWHGAAKPLIVVKDILSRISPIKGNCNDPFLGSGTTLIACEQSERTCYGMEINPIYIDLILGRYAEFTGNDPVREDGITWSELQNSKTL